MKWLLRIFIAILALSYSVWAETDAVSCGCGIELLNGLTRDAKHRLIETRPTAYPRPTIASFRGPSNHLRTQVVAENDESKPEIFSPFSLFQREKPSKKLRKNTTNTLDLQLQEFLLDTTLNFGPAPGDQDFADIAFDGTNYFVVWQDWRNGDIYGARVTSTGILLDTFGIPICTTWATQEYPSVAFDGTNYLVVWDDVRNFDFDIYGARVTPNGVVLDPEGIPISTALYDQTLPSIEFDGTNYLVAWNDFRNEWESDIYAARVTPNGTVLDPDGIAVSTAPYEQTIMLRGIAFDGTNYLLVWHDDRDGDYYYDVYGARVTQTGVVLDPDGIPISVAQNNQGFAQVGFDGTNFFVVWLDDRTIYEDYRIYGARVTTGGVVIDSNGIQITQYFSVYPSVDFDGTNYFVTWTDGRSGWQADIYGSRVTTTGIILDPEGIPIATPDESDQWMSVILFDGTRYFTTWSDFRNGYSDIYGARVTTGGTVLDPDGILLDYGYFSPEQNSSAVAFDGTNYLVVWTDYRNGEADIYGARVTPGGRVLDPEGIPISTAWDYQEFPAIAFDGTNYLVVWQDYRNWEFDIYGARVTPTGVVLDPDGIPISTASYDQYFPSLDFDGTNYLIAWTDERSGDESDIYGTRVSRAGTVLDPNGIPICTATYDQYPPDVAFDGTNYFVVWDDGRSGEYYDIYGTRVTTGGYVLEPNGIAISTAPYEQWFPQVAFDGIHYFVVWQDDRDGDWYWDVYGTRVNLGGVVLEPQGIPVSTAEESQYNPTLAFDGTNYLVVWTDNRNWAADIYGARVTSAGTVLDPQGIELINQLEPRFDPSIVKGPSSQLLLTFTGYVPLCGATKILGAFYPSPGITEDITTKIDFGFKVLPNPIRKTGMVELTLAKESEIELALFDVSGRKVSTIVSGIYPLGIHQIQFNTKTITPGLYFLRLKIEKQSLVTKVINIK